MVFAGFYTVEGEDYADLKDALEKLQLNDASLVYEPETSQALNFGFRCGFLGLFHMDIIQERLEREYDLDVIATAPSVEYEVVLLDGTVRQSQFARRAPGPRTRSAKSASRGWSSRSSRPTRITERRWTWSPSGAVCSASRR